MYKKILRSALLSTFFLSSLLFAQWKLIDREGEKQQYQSLEKTGKSWDKNVQEAFGQLARFGFLIELAKKDRATAILAEKEPHNFRHDKRELKLVPWRNSIRYIKEGDQFILNSFGKIEEIKGLVSKKIQLAAQNNVQVPNLTIGAREGVEISQFGFIYANDPDKTRAVGSQRKWMSLYYNNPNELAAVVLRVEYHNFRAGVKETELVIDPSPVDDQMDDIIILHRYNQVEPKVYLVALMHNDKAYNNRNKFKSKYHGYVRGHFLQMIERISNYNILNPTKAHEKEVDRLERGLSY